MVSFQGISQRSFRRRHKKFAICQQDDGEMQSLKRISLCLCNRCILYLGYGRQGACYVGVRRLIYLKWLLNRFLFKFLLETKKQTCQTSRLEFSAHSTRLRLFLGTKIWLMNIFVQGNGIYFWHFHAYSVNLIWDKNQESTTRLNNHWCGKKILKIV